MASPFFQPLQDLQALGATATQMQDAQAMTQVHRMEAMQMLQQINAEKYAAAQAQKRAQAGKVADNVLTSLTQRATDLIEGGDLNGGTALLDKVSQMQERLSQSQHMQMETEKNAYDIRMGQLKTAENLLAGAKDPASWRQLQDWARQTFGDSRDPALAQILSAPYNPRLVSVLQNAVMTQADRIRAQHDAAMEAHDQAELARQTAHDRAQEAHWSNLDNSRAAKAAADAAKGGKLPVTAAGIRKQAFEYVVQSEQGKNLTDEQKALVGDSAADKAMELIRANPGLTVSQALQRTVEAELSQVPRGYKGVGMIKENPIVVDPQNPPEFKEGVWYKNPAGLVKKYLGNGQWGD